MGIHTRNIPIHGTKLTLGIGWNERRSEGHDYDLDSSVLLVGYDGKCHEPQDLCFYKAEHQKVHNGAVVHYGDEKSGAAIGDDEVIDINLNLIPDRIETLIVCVTIYQAKARKLNFGLVDGAYIRILDENEKEIISYDLSEEASLETGLEFCELVRKGKDWECRIVERKTKGGLSAIISQYGFNAT